MWNAFTNIFLQLLIFFYNLFGGDLGLAIIAVTVLIKLILLPLIVPSLKSAKKMQDLKPHLDKLKTKYSDKTQLQQAQMDLYREHGINPAAGCLPQIVQIVILIALYRVFIDFIGKGVVGGQAVNPNFLYLDLGKKDPYYILPILAGATQLIFSFMMQSGLEAHVKNPKKKQEKKKEADSLEMAQSMQSQMLYMMPLMTVIISLNFQSGLVLYWVISTLFSIIQQYFFSGWGGLAPYLTRLGLLKVNQTKNG